MMMCTITMTSSNHHIPQGADPAITENPEPLYDASGCCSSGTSELTAGGRVRLTVSQDAETGALVITLAKSNQDAMTSDPTIYLKVTRVLQDGSDSSLGQ